MQTRFSPVATPLPLKVLLATTIGLSFFSSLLLPYFALSLETWTHFRLWQFATYLFLNPLPSSLFQLAFNLYLLWIFGSSLIERIGSLSFFILYFGSGICGGLCALFAMSLFSLPPLFFSSLPAIYALLTAWALLNPDARMLLFFALPFKARSLLLFLIGANLLIDLSQLRWDFFFAYMGAILFGYFFSVLVCKSQSPFRFLAPFENMLLRILEKITHLRKRPYRHSKIFDIKSGEPVLDDEQFMDAMLARISLYGEESLSIAEKTRMERISKNKASKKSDY